MTRERIVASSSAVAAKKVPPKSITKGKSTKLPKMLRYKRNEKIGPTVTYVAGSAVYLYY